jgi:hypothetical protein
VSTLLDLPETERRPVPTCQARRLSSGPPSERIELTLVCTVGAPGALYLCCEVERA